MTEFSADTAAEFAGALGEIARNFAFSWHPAARAVWERIDGELFQRVDRNPVEFLAQLPQDVLERSARDETLRAEAARVRDAILAERDAPVRLEVEDGLQVAYFSLEFGL